MQKDLISRRRALAETGRSLPCRGTQKDARAVRRLVEHVAAEGTVGSVIAALEDGRRSDVSAPGARIRTLFALAERASGPARQSIRGYILAAAEKAANMDDAGAWVCAARVAKGRARARFSEAAIAAAGRSQTAAPVLAALTVAKDAAAENLVHLAVGHLAQAMAGMQLGVLPFDTSIVRTSCEELSEDGARWLVRRLGHEDSEPQSNVGPLVTAARARLLARCVSILPNNVVGEVASQLASLAPRSGLALDDEEREAVLSRIGGADLDAALENAWFWSTGSLAVRLSALGRVEEAWSLLESMGGGWYSAVA
ncbi:MAG: hypothetical protein R3B70_45250, partial [Polyangiaceae bacterium]